MVVRALAASGARAQARRARSAEKALVRGLVEADDELASFAQRRSAQIAGRPEEQAEELGARRLVALEVEVHDLLALGHVEFVNVLEGAKRGVTLDRGFLGVGLRGDGDLVLRKEPLRFGAGGSALAVVAPVDGAHVVLLSGAIRSLQRDRGAQVFQEPIEIVRRHRALVSQRLDPAVERAAHVGAIGRRQGHQ